MLVVVIRYVLIYLQAVHCCTNCRTSQIIHAQGPRGDHTPLRFITTCDKNLLPYIICHRWSFKLWYFFYIYITIDGIFFIFFDFFLSSSFFVVIVLVQSCIILVRNGVFYEKHKSSYLVTIFYSVIDTVYIYSWKKKLIKFWPILVMLYVKSRFFFITHGVQHDNRVNPPGYGPYKIFTIVVMPSRASMPTLQFLRLESIIHP